MSENIGFTCRGIRVEAGVSRVLEEIGRSGLVYRQPAGFLLVYGYVTRDRLYLR